MLTTRQAAEDAGLDRILIDFREMSPPARQLDRFLAGIHVAEVWRPPLRVAGVWQPERIDRFAEDTAVNRGAVFRMFVDEAAAVDWLNEQPAS